MASSHARRRDLFFQILQQKGRPPFNKRLDTVAKMEKVGDHSVRFTFNDKADRETPLIIAASTPILPSTPSTG